MPRKKAPADNRPREVICSFCSKWNDEVAAVWTANRAAICNECAALCVPPSPENPMSLADRELRLECLRLALMNVTGSHETVVRDAGAFFDFVTGAQPSASAEELAAIIGEQSDA